MNIHHWASQGSGPAASSRAPRSNVLVQPRGAGSHSHKPHVLILEQRQSLEILRPILFWFSSLSSPFPTCPLVPADFPAPHVFNKSLQTTLLAGWWCRALSGVLDDVRWTCWTHIVIPPSPPPSIDQPASPTDPLRMCTRLCTLENANMCASLLQTCYRVLGAGSTIEGVAASARSWTWF